MLLQLGLEASFDPLLTLALLSTLGVDEGRGFVVGVLTVINVLRVAFLLLVAARSLRPVERWRALSEIKQDTPEVALDAARATYRLPYVYAVTAAAAWGVALPGLVIVLAVMFPDRVALDPQITPAIVMWTISMVFGAALLSFPLAEWALGREVRAVSLRLRELGVPNRGRGMSLTARLMLFTLLWATGPAVLLAANGYLTAARGRAQVAATENHAALLELAAAARTPDPATGKLPDLTALVDGRAGAFLLAGDARVRGALARSTFAEHEPVMTQLGLEVARAPSGRILDVRSGIAVSYTRIDPSTVLGMVALTHLGPGQGFWTLSGFMLVLVALGTLISTRLLTRSTVAPIEKLSSVVEEIRLGRVASAQPVAIYHHDESGKLAEDVNGMLDVLCTLAEQARSVGTGDLSTSFSIGGDLGESFRAQLDSLRGIVSHLAQNATQLGAAATELYAASQEQETAAGHQSAGVNEVGKTMDSLLAAAAHISEATQGVLAKAERTRETTDRTAEKIGELSAHAGRIGEILDVIREIADRSDLLAL
ncbi:MAG TPA: methyl-accepting chemotaxis protein, partial [Kofleriaceae bacterium]|nr:methyl-accepting chemotaxis protein [Kofleriaceae bacterium]